jgi:ankyrin repeat protein
MAAGKAAEMEHSAQTHERIQSTSPPGCSSASIPALERSVQQLECNKATLPIATRAGEDTLTKQSTELTRFASVPRPKGPTALHLAVRQGHREAVATLIAHGANTNLVDGEGKTALHVAAELGSHDLIKLLLLHGANVDATASLANQTATS